MVLSYLGSSEQKTVGAHDFALLSKKKKKCVYEKRKNVYILLTFSLNFSRIGVIDAGIV